ncbi:MAG: cysteine dioxygenase [Kineosporiaceae bacterium]
MTIDTSSDTSSDTNSDPSTGRGAGIDVRPAGPARDLWSALPARTLATHELASLVDDLATRPDLWRRHVDYSDDRRVFVSLRRDEHVDVWLLCWTSANDTGWHDHDISSVAYHVVEGALCEQNPRMNGTPRQTLLGPGSSVAFGPEHIHRLGGVAARSVSIHAYSPPLWRLGRYAISDDGVMTRVSVSYAEELRPFDAAPRDAPLDAPRDATPPDGPRDATPPPSSGGEGAERRPSWGPFATRGRRGQADSASRTA